MTNSISEEKVRKALAEIKHPAIDSSLIDLGIMKGIAVEDNRVILTLAFPFPNIPIADMLINSVLTPIEKLGAEVEIVTTIMNQEELQAFLRMEQEGWIGG
jgi:ATP-binding protein involved in chromosome partitioning